MPLIVTSISYISASKYILTPKATAGTDMDAVRALSCMCEADDKDVQEESLESVLLR